MKRKTAGCFRVLSLHDRGDTSRLSAFASVLQLYPPDRFTTREGPWAADAEALASDWQNVAEDLWAAARAVRNRGG